VRLNRIILYTLSNILISVSIPALSGNGLPAYIIKGIVLNNETGAPVPLAEAFISGTTFGSITNAEGVFELLELHRDIQAQTRPQFGRPRTLPSRSSSTSIAVSRARRPSS